MHTPEEWLELARLKIASLRPWELSEAGILFPPGEFVPVVSYPPITMFPPVDPSRHSSQ